MSDVISGEDLHKSYTLPHGKVDVLAGAGLRVTEGEKLAIVGRSGSGKSTLMHILGGLDQPDRGDLTVLGENLTHAGRRGLSKHNRALMRAQGIGFIFQSYHLLPELDIIENVTIPTMTGAFMGSRAGARDRGKELLERVGLGHRIQHHPNELSGGEQQRVAIARALVNDPALILADEPTGNLDESTGDVVLDSLFELCGEGRSTLVMVTHNRDVAARCDRTLLLEDGLLVEKG